MRSVSLRLEDLQKVTIPIGFVGENEHTRVLIDCKKMYEEYPTAAASMTVRPPKGEAYPAVVVRDGDIVIWDVTDSDLILEGIGEIQLGFSVDTVEARSFIGQTRIWRSIMPTGEIPDPLANFLTQAGAALTLIPETINQALADAKASGEFDGPQGPEGPAGADGKDGAPGRDGKDGADGAPGADGVTYTPSVSSEGVISWTNDGNRQNPSPVNIKGPAGPAGADGQQGPAGRDGQDATPDLIAVAYEDLTYPVSTGTLCYNGEVLYRAKQEIQTSESWTAGHWDATTVADELSRQYGAINGKADEPTGTKSAGKVYGLNANLEPEWVEQSGGGQTDIGLSIVDGKLCVTYEEASA